MTIQGRGVTLMFMVVVSMVGLLLWSRIAGGIFVEKMLTTLVMPAGLLFLFLLVLCFYLFASRQRAVGIVCVLVTLSYWCLASPLGGTLAMRWLERDFQPVDFATVESFDTLIVLGGGISVLTDGSAQLSPAGDRVATGMRLWHSGKAKRVLINASLFFDHTIVEKNKLPQSPLVIWQQLGIDMAQIETFSGRNTSEEIASIRELLGNTANERVGLVTSARHMPRALRLARGQQLELIPVAADFRSLRPLMPLPISLLPHHWGITKTSAVWKELLAGLVGR